MKEVVLFVVLSVVVAITIPLYALETDFSGEFYVEGILNSSMNMLDSDNTSDYRQMRLRVQTQFQVNDNLKFITRFDALEKVLSSGDSAFDNMQDDDNIDFDRAYLSYISPIGIVDVGRMEGNTWGTTFCNDKSDTDRVKYTVPVEIGEGTLYLGAVAEKVTENNPMIDDDNDKYYLASVYKTENHAMGLLTAFYNFKKFQETDQAYAIDDLIDSYETNLNAASYRDFISSGHAPDNIVSYIRWYSGNAMNAMRVQKYAEAAAAYQAAGDIASAEAAAAANSAAAKINGDWPDDMADSSLMTIASKGTTNEAKAYMFAPYYQGRFGDLALEAELDYIFGTVKYRERYNAEDRDVKTLAYFAQAGYDLSSVTVTGGFAYMSGDADSDDDKFESMGFITPGLDWEKLFILNSDYHGMNGTLGNGVGNHVGRGFATASTCMLDGYQMFYSGIDYAVTDSVTLGFIGALSRADDIPDAAGYDDDQGIEYDFSLTWNINSNLTYRAIAAYLDGGDYWTTRASEGVVDPAVDPQVYALFHRLTLTF